MDQQLNRPAVPANVPPAVFTEGEPSREHEARDEVRGDRLAVRIARVVKRRTAGSVQNLRVEVRRDGVYLDGQCETFYTKQLAQQAAMDLADEKPLTNRIEVR
ncbi:MAG TPA: BON domain-containing protein [Pirellulales bacterium]|nr:BON domain-containing protein [Pirellulales bacterium]